MLPPQRDARGRAVTRDHVALFVTTAGAGIRELAEAAKQRGRVPAFVRAAGARARDGGGGGGVAARRLRALWGFPDGDRTAKKDLFQAHYRGKRYSFGYPACPDLEQQAALFRLLRPEEIGVELTEGFMMEPEASVSALVFHHPDAAYFSTSPGED